MLTLYSVYPLWELFTSTVTNLKFVTDISLLLFLCNLMNKLLSSIAAFLYGLMLEAFWNALDLFPSLIQDYWF